MNLKKSDKDRQRIADLASVLGSRGGRRFILRLLRVLDSDPTNVTSANDTYFRLGWQKAARALQDEIISEHFDTYKLLLSEMHSDDEDSTCKVVPE